MQTVLSSPSCGNPPLSLPCFAGLRSDGLCSVLWVRSPRTGKQINIYEPELNQVRPLLARVAKSRAESRSQTDFTSAELKALFALTQPSAKPTAPAARAAKPKDDRLVEVPPGTPPSCAVWIDLRVLETRPSGYWVELPTDPRGRVFLPRKVVGLGTATNRYNVTHFRLPIWLFQKVRTQL